MNGPVFVDTNVLIYERDSREPTKQAAAAAWLRQLWEAKSGRLSYQVLAEFYSCVTLKLKPGMPAAEAQRHVRALVAWRPVVLEETLLGSGWALQWRYRLNFWDALILAAAKTARCRFLLSEDFQSGQEFEDTTVLSPFAARPGDLP